MQATVNRPKGSCAHNVPLTDEQQKLLTDMMEVYPHPVAWLCRCKLRLYRKCLAHGLEHDDISQAAMLGAVVAAQKYDPTRGAKFRTCCIWWVYSYVQLLLRQAIRARRLDAIRRESLYDAPASVDAADSLADREYSQTMIPKFLAVLSPRQAKMLRWYYGVGIKRPLNCTEIGRKFGVSKSRAQQIIAGAIAKIQSHVSRGQYERV